MDREKTKAEQEREAKEAPAPDLREAHDPEHPEHLTSINEPPGSEVIPEPAPPEGEIDALNEEAEYADEEEDDEEEDAKGSAKAKKKKHR